uniref:CalpainB n=1 Tax=Hemiscolopendra marginata TaxID=943146 RepID=A0A646QE62_9MYRI
MPYQHKNTTVYFFGERGSGLRPRGEIQDFYKIRSQCLNDGVLFEDPEFPALDSSIYYSRSPPRPFEWKRPSELVENPHLFVEGASRFDVIQGELGDCWLLAAVANLTLHPQIFHKVVPDDQSFGEDYAGIFHFRFWQYGKWVDVVVDDRLPTFCGRLILLQSKDKNEFWSALLEKAYAKLHGSYESLKGGTTCEAMEDFTGGVTEVYELDKAPSNLFTIMIKAYERMSLLGCSITPDPSVTEAELPNGLIRGHAYSITAVRLVEIRTGRKSGKIPLLRIRNPWGNEAEWKGAWSDQSREWKYIPDSEKEDLGLTFDADGEFWMSFADFMKNFMTLEICNLSPDSLDEELLTDNSKKGWSTQFYEGCWSKGVSAGGCRNYIETFWYNPQYLITLEDPDEDDDEDKCTVIIALMQKNRRAQRKKGLDTLTIGFAIYNVKDPDSTPRPLPKRFFEYNASVARSPSFINLREVTTRFKLNPGTYCIIPSTFEPNEEGEFVLRVFSEKKNQMSEFDNNIGEGEIDDRVERPDDSPDKKDALKESFKKIAGDDLEIDAYELKEVMDFILQKEFDFGGFGLNLCRAMVAMMDSDLSGKLGLEEFMQLWQSILTWKNVFKLYDKDNSGALNTFELRAALTSAGYHMNWKVLRILRFRYGNKDGTISFEDFIGCAVKLKNMIEMFRKKDVKKLNMANFTIEEWIEATMYA